MPTALMHHGARYEPWRRTGTSLWLGASEMRIIIRHMVPSFSSHLFAVLTLRVPEMILAETSLSFLGLGLREPVISWGVLLTGVQNIRAVAVPAGGGDRGDGAGVQLRRRRPARRRRPLLPVARQHTRAATRTRTRPWTSGPRPASLVVPPRQA